MSHLRQAGIDTANYPATGSVRLGLRANWPQFALLVLVNAFVGGMVGLERTVVPLIGAEEFQLASTTLVTSFIVSFGIVKACANLVAGQLADMYGRKRVLVLGWLVGLPVPFLIMFAPSWDWIVAANALLGINQGLAWSMTVLMKIDLVGPSRRGLAMGLNEAAGYGAVGLTALATGYLAALYGLRPQPFYLGVVYAARGARGSCPVGLPPGVLAHELAPAHAVRCQPGWTREQPQRWHVLGDFPSLLRRPRRRAGGHRPDQGDLPGGVGSRPARDGLPERPLGPQGADRGRDVGPGARAGDHRRGGGPARSAASSGRPRWERAVGRRHRHGVSSTAGSGGRRRASRLAGALAERLSLLAGHGLRRRRVGLRAHCRCIGPDLGDRGGGGPDLAFGDSGPARHAGAAPPPARAPPDVSVPHERRCAAY